jgi:hypothetical protein
MSVGEWTSFVKTYAAENNITYKKALSQASEFYRKRNNNTEQPIPETKPETKPKKEKKKPIVEPVVEPILPPQKSNIKKKC